MARYEQIKREEAYRFYITDQLYLRGQNKYLNTRFADSIKPTNTKVDNRKPEEIVADIVKRGGLKLKEE